MSYSMYRSQLKSSSKKKNRKRDRSALSGGSNENSHPGSLSGEIMANMGRQQVALGSEIAKTTKKSILSPSKHSSILMNSTPSKDGDRRSVDSSGYGGQYVHSRGKINDVYSQKSGFNDENSFDLAKSIFSKKSHPAATRLFQEPLPEGSNHLQGSQVGLNHPNSQNMSRNENLLETSTDTYYKIEDVCDDHRDARPTQSHPEIPFNAPQMDQNLEYHQRGSIGDQSQESSMDRRRSHGTSGGTPYQAYRDFMKKDYQKPVYNRGIINFFDEQPQVIEVENMDYQQPIGAINHRFYADEQYSLVNRELGGGQEARFAPGYNYSENRQHLLEEGIQGDEEGQKPVLNTPRVSQTSNEATTPPNNQSHPYEAEEGQNDQIQGNQEPTTSNAPFITPNHHQSRPDPEQSSQETDYYLSQNSSSQSSAPSASTVKKDYSYAAVYKEQLLCQKMLSPVTEQRSMEDKYDSTGYIFQSKVSSTQAVNKLIDLPTLNIFNSKDVQNTLGSIDPDSNRISSIRGGPGNIRIEGAERRMTFDNALCTKTIDSLQSGGRETSRSTNFNNSKRSYQKASSGGAQSGVSPVKTQSLLKTQKELSGLVSEDNSVITPARNYTITPRNSTPATNKFLDAMEDGDAGREEISISEGEGEAFGDPPMPKSQNSDTTYGVAVDHSGVRSERRKGSLDALELKDEKRNYFGRVKFGGVAAGKLKPSSNSNNTRHHGQQKTNDSNIEGRGAGVGHHMDTVMIDEHGCGEVKESQNHNNSHTSESNGFLKSQHRGSLAENSSSCEAIVVKEIRRETIHTQIESRAVIGDEVEGRGVNNQVIEQEMVARDANPEGQEPNHLQLEQGGEELQNEPQQLELEHREDPEVLESNSRLRNLYQEVGFDYKAQDIHNHQNSNLGEDEVNREHFSDHQCSPVLRQVRNDNQVDFNLTKKLQINQNFLQPSKPASSEKPQSREHTDHQKNQPYLPLGDHHYQEASYHKQQHNWSSIEEDDQRVSQTSHRELEHPQIDQNEDNQPPPVAAASCQVSEFGSDENDPQDEIMMTEVYETDQEGLSSDGRLSDTNTEEYKIICQDPVDYSQLPQNHPNQLVDTSNASLEHYREIRYPEGYKTSGFALNLERLAIEIDETKQTSISGRSRYNSHQSDIQARQKPQTQDSSSCGYVEESQNSKNNTISKSSILDYKPIFTSYDFECITPNQKVSRAEGSGQQEFGEKSENTFVNLKSQYHAERVDITPEDGFQDSIEAIEVEAEVGYLRKGLGGMNAPGMPPLPHKKGYMPGKCYKSNIIDSATMLIQDEDPGGSEGPRACDYRSEESLERVNGSGKLGYGQNDDFEDIGQIADFEGAEGYDGYRGSVEPREGADYGYQGPDMDGSLLGNQETEKKYIHDVGLVEAPNSTPRRLTTGLNSASYYQSRGNDKNVQKIKNIGEEIKGLESDDDEYLGYQNDAQLPQHASLVAPVTGGQPKRSEKRSERKRLIQAKKAKISPIGRQDEQNLTMESLVESAHTPQPQNATKNQQKVQKTKKTQKTQKTHSFQDNSGFDISKPNQFQMNLESFTNIDLILDGQQIQETGTLVTSRDPDIAYLDQLPNNTSQQSSHRSEDTSGDHLGRRLKAGSSKMIQNLLISSQRNEDISKDLSKPQATIGASSVDSLCCEIVEPENSNENPNFGYTSDKVQFGLSGLNTGHRVAPNNLGVQVVAHVRAVTPQKRVVKDIKDFDMKRVFEEARIGNNSIEARFRVIREDPEADCGNNEPLAALIRESSRREVGGSQSQSRALTPLSGSQGVPGAVQGHQNEVNASNVGGLRGNQRGITTNRISRKSKHSHSSLMKKASRRCPGGKGQPGAHQNRQDCSGSLNSSQKRKNFNLPDFGPIPVKKQKKKIITRKRALRYSYQHHSGYSSAKAAGQVAVMPILVNELAHGGKGTGKQEIVGIRGTIGLNSSSVDLRDLDLGQSQKYEILTSNPIKSSQEQISEAPGVPDTPLNDGEAGPEAINSQRSQYVIIPKSDKSGQFFDPRLKLGYQAHQEHPNKHQETRRVAQSGQNSQNSSLQHQQTRRQVKLDYGYQNGKEGTKSMQHSQVLVPKGSKVSISSSKSTKSRERRNQRNRVRGSSRDLRETTKEMGHLSRPAETTQKWNTALQVSQSQVVTPTGRNNKKSQNQQILPKKMGNRVSRRRRDSPGHQIPHQISSSDKFIPKNVQKSQSRKTIKDTGLSTRQRPISKERKATHVREDNPFKTTNQSTPILLPSTKNIPKVKNEQKTRKNTKRGDSRQQPQQRHHSQATLPQTSIQTGRSVVMAASSSSLEQRARKMRSSGISVTSALEKSRKRLARRIRSSYQNVAYSGGGGAGSENLSIHSSFRNLNRKNRNSRVSESLLLASKHGANLFKRKGLNNASSSTARRYAAPSGSANRKNSTKNPQKSKNKKSAKNGKIGKNRGSKIAKNEKKGLKASTKALERPQRPKNHTPEHQNYKHQKYQKNTKNSNTPTGGVSIDTQSIQGAHARSVTPTAIHSKNLRVNGAHLSHLLDCGILGASLVVSTSTPNHHNQINLPGTQKGTHNGAFVQNVFKSGTGYQNTPTLSYQSGLGKTANGAFGELDQAGRTPVSRLGGDKSSLMAQSTSMGNSLIVKTSVTPVRQKMNQNRLNGAIGKPMIVNGFGIENQPSKGFGPFDQNGAVSGSSVERAKASGALFGEVKGLGYQNPGNGLNSPSEVLAKNTRENSVSLTRLRHREYVPGYGTLNRGVNVPENGQNSREASRVKYYSKAKTEQEKAARLNRIVSKKQKSSQRKVGESQRRKIDQKSKNRKNENSVKKIKNRVNQGPQRTTMGTHLGVISAGGALYAQNRHKRMGFNFIDSINQMGQKRHRRAISELDGGYPQPSYTLETSKNHRKDKSANFSKTDFELEKSIRSDKNEHFGRHMHHGYVKEEPRAPKKSPKGVNRLGSRSHKKGSKQLSGSSSQRRHVGGIAKKLSNSFQRIEKLGQAKPPTSNNMQQNPQKQPKISEKSQNSAFLDSRGQPVSRNLNKSDQNFRIAFQAGRINSHKNGAIPDSWKQSGSFTTGRKKGYLLGGDQTGPDQSRKVWRDSKRTPTNRANRGSIKMLQGAPEYSQTTAELKNAPKKPKNEEIGSTAQTVKNGSRGVSGQAKTTGRVRGRENGHKTTSRSRPNSKKSILSHRLLKVDDPARGHQNTKNTSGKPKLGTNQSKQLKLGQEQIPSYRNFNPKNNPKTSPSGAEGAGFGLNNPSSSSRRRFQSNMVPQSSSSSMRKNPKFSLLNSSSRGLATQKRPDRYSSIQPSTYKAKAASGGSRERLKAVIHKNGPQRQYESQNTVGRLNSTQMDHRAGTLGLDLGLNQPGSSLKSTMRILAENGKRGENRQKEQRSKIGGYVGGRGGDSRGGVMADRLYRSNKFGNSGSGRGALGGLQSGPGGREYSSRGRVRSRGLNSSQESGFGAKNGASGFGEVGSFNSKFSYFKRRRGI